MNGFVISLIFVCRFVIFLFFFFRNGSPRTALYFNVCWGIAYGGMSGETIETIVSLDMKIINVNKNSFMKCASECQVTSESVHNLFEFSNEFFGR